MKVTKEFLREKHACTGGYKWFCENCLELDFEDQIKQLKQHRYDWTNWLLVRLMSLEQKRKYAIFAAQQVLDIFEAKYPDDERPRKAIEAAEAVLENDTKENRAKADVAAAAAYAAYADATDAAEADAYTAYAAAAAYDAAAAADDTDATGDSAYAYDAAADAASADAASADSTMKEAIINKGIELLRSLE